MCAENTFPKQHKWNKFKVYIQAILTNFHTKQWVFSQKYGMIFKSHVAFKLSSISCSELPKQNFCSDWCKPNLRKWGVGKWVLLLLLKSFEGNHKHLQCKEHVTGFGILLVLEFRSECNLFIKKHLYTAYELIHILCTDRTLPEWQPCLHPCISQ